MFEDYLGDQCDW